MIKINFKRLLEINNNLDNLDDILNEEEKIIIYSKKAVYVIFNDRLNKAYIGETVDVFSRLFTFWKKDKRHVNGENSPIKKYFNNDTEYTYFAILESDCDNLDREYYWHKYYRENNKYLLVSHPGRHGCTNPGNKNLIAIHKDDVQIYINKDDLNLYLKNDWLIGGKTQGERTFEQKKNISIAHIGKIPWNKGIKLTEEQKSHYKGIKKNIKEKRVYSEEQRQLLREKNIGRKKINNGNIEKQVLETEIPYYISMGWKLGCKSKTKN